MFYRLGISLCRSARYTGQKLVKIARHAALHDFQQRSFKQEHTGSYPVRVTGEDRQVTPKRFDPTHLTATAEQAPLRRALGRDTGATGVGSACASSLIAGSPSGGLYEVRLRRYQSLLPEKELTEFPGHFLANSPSAHFWPQSIQFWADFLRCSPETINWVQHQLRSSLSAN